MLSLLSKSELSLPTWCLNHMSQGEGVGNYISSLKNQGNFENCTDFYTYEGIEILLF